VVRSGIDFLALTLFWPGNLKNFAKVEGLGVDDCLNDWINLRSIHHERLQVRICNGVDYVRWY